MTKKSKKKYKKAPQAPRRFKSAYMFFSTTKHTEIREALGTKGVAEKTTNIAKLVSKAWKELSTEERDKWDEMARKDKLRFEVEKSLYTGPWKVPAKKRSQRDPNAPKRPMSAFLAYSHSKRAEVKAENPGMNNAEISRLLSQIWKDAPEEEKKEHIEKEYELRQKYLSEIKVWRENQEKDLKEQRNHREEIALKTVAARGNSQEPIEGQQVAYNKDDQAAAGYGEYYQGSTASQFYGSSAAAPGTYSQDYRGYPPYYPPPGHHQQYDQALGGPPEAVADGAYAAHRGADYYAYSNYGYYPPPQDHQYPGGYGGNYGEYAQPPQSYNGARFYDRHSYPPPREDYDQSRMANEHYRHGHPSNEDQPPVYGDDGTFNDMKPPAAQLPDQNEAYQTIQHDGQAIDERK
mmetsp:Transcript_7118/g.10380  ORF Transcript_7118/g.10380 Transcript_7118/m.10380 type:complete len:405 (-) Transcript_7118:25-1239(-)